MKKWFIVVLLAVITVVGCKKKEQDSPQQEPTFTDLMIGTWINTQVDHIQVPTNQQFCMQLTPSYTQKYAQGYALLNNESQWMESDDYSYSIQDKTIVIDGKNALDASTHLEMEVSQVDANTLVYTVKQLIINDEVISDEHVYTCQKTTLSYHSDILGVWYGKDVTEGSTDTTYKYWEYLSNGSFKYYYFDAASNLWICKEDNNGHYFLYGNLLATNFTNNLQTQEEGVMYECWNISIVDGKMEWTALRENNTTSKFMMEKVDQPPVTDYSSMILGTWINTEIDGNVVLSDQSFMLKFDASLMETYAQGYTFEGDNQLWKESNNYIYAVDKNIITINGIDALGQSSFIELNISNIQNGMMTYTVQKLEINGTAITDNKTYVFRQETANHQDAIKGVWKGHETTPGVTQTHDYYWEYLANGLYNFYYFDENTGHYVLKVDNAGTYFLYGSFLAMNCINPYLSNFIGTDYECWNIDIQQNSMSWTGKKEQGDISFSFEKVPNPPTVR